MAGKALHIARVSDLRDRRRSALDTWVTLVAFGREALVSWRECSVTGECLRFIKCASISGISHKTGYKIFESLPDGGARCAVRPLAPTGPLMIWAIST